MRPGATYRDVKAVMFDQWRPVHAPGDIAGVYRARYFVFRDYARDPAAKEIITELAPEEATVTNEFTLVEP